MIIYRRVCLVLITMLAENIYSLILIKTSFYFNIARCPAAKAQEIRLLGVTLSLRTENALKIALP